MIVSNSDFKVSIHYTVNPDAIAYNYAIYGEETVPILLDNIRCAHATNNGRRIDCPHTANENCAHSQDAAVSCTTSNVLIN